MRSGLVLTILFLGAAWALVHPWVGVLLWTWISLMNPHQLTWGAEDFPVAAVAGGATLVGLILSKDKKNFFLSAPSVVLILFMLWMCITYLFSFFPEKSTEMLTRVLKIDFMILVALVLLHSKQHIFSLVWVLVLSLGFYGVKGGIFTLATGGGYHVNGPPTSFIGGNNEIALALIMIVPFMHFLRDQARKTWQRHAWLLAMALTSIAVIGSQSRGALLGVVAMLALFWIRARQKLLFGILIVLGGILLFTFMPESWHERMDTIKTYQQDSSAMGRINAWWMAWNLATHNLFGGGFSIYTSDVFARYAPNPLDVHAAHSIYFQVLGEHGFVGLGLYLTLWGLIWSSAGWLRKNATGNPETEWAAVLGSMCQVSLIGYAVGGAFLGLAYFDLPYDILVLVVLARRLVEAHRNNKEAANPESGREGLPLAKVTRILPGRSG
ncbi:MAG: putative O-glycosylation ligase, exosortase A system-associated [Gallionellaceae bacterium]